MDNFVKKQNINKINPSSQISTVKPVIKEAGGNFFGTLTNSNIGFSWKDDVGSEISKIQRITKNVEDVLNTGITGSNLNIMG